MANSLSFAQISRLKREAKKAVREGSVTHAEALDRIAAAHGFANWSLLSKTHVSRGAPLKPASAKARALVQKRYYLHGDQDETDSSLFYCVRCDSFCPPEHFANARLHPGQSHEMRYLESIERWNERGAKWRAEWRRPSDPVNLLAAAAVEVNACYQSSRSPFHRWLLAQISRDDVVADLAVDVRSDRGFPVSATCPDEIRAYLSRHGDHALDALDEAWDEFSAGHRSV